MTFTAIWEGMVRKWGDAFLMLIKKRMLKTLKYTHLKYLHFLFKKKEKNCNLWCQKYQSVKNLIFMV